MNFKTIINNALQQQGYSLKDLASYIKISESALKTALQNNDLNNRQLEKICKALKIPLYSLLNDKVVAIPGGVKPFHVWDNDNPDQSIQNLEEEIKMLQELLAYKRRKLRQLKAG